MTEQLVRDLVAEKRRSRSAKLQDRIARGEKDFAVLLTRFDASVRDAVTREDLEAAKKEAREAMHEVASGMLQEVRRTVRQESRISRVKTNRQIDLRFQMLEQEHQKTQQEQQKTRRRMFSYAIAILSILALLTGGQGVQELLRLLGIMWPG